MSKVYIISSNGFTMGAFSSEEKMNAGMEDMVFLENVSICEVELDVVYPYPESVTPEPYVPSTGNDEFHLGWPR